MLTERQRLRLEHIIENAERIEGYVAGLGYQDFAADQKTVDAVERCLARITEAAIRVGEEGMAEVAPDVPAHIYAASATPCATTMTRPTSTRSGRPRRRTCRC